MSLMRQFPGFIDEQFRVLNLNLTSDFFPLGNQKRVRDDQPGVFIFHSLGPTTKVSILCLFNITYLHIWLYLKTSLYVQIIASFKFSDLLANRSWPCLWDNRNNSWNFNRLVVTHEIHYSWNLELRGGGSCFCFKLSFSVLGRINVTTWLTTHWRVERWQWLPVHSSSSLIVKYFNAILREHSQFSGATDGWGG